MLVRHSKNLNDVVSFIPLDTTILNISHEMTTYNFIENREDHVLVERGNKYQFQFRFETSKNGWIRLS